MQEDLGFIQHVKTFFADHPHNHHQQPHPPKPALSEHSTSNPATSSDHPSRFHSPSVPPMYVVADPPVNGNPEDEEEEEEEEEEDEDEDGESGSEAETGRDGRPNIAEAQNPQGIAAAEPSELMQLEMSEDIRLGSPDDGSNNLDSDFHMLAVSQSANPTSHQRQADSYRAESTRRWPLVQDPLGASGMQVQPPDSGIY